MAMLSDLHFIQLTDVLKNIYILLWTQISNFGHFAHFDFGHKSTQNPGAMPQLWHLTLATCPRICGTINSTKMTVALFIFASYLTLSALRQFGPEFFFSTFCYQRTYFDRYR